MKFWTVQHIDVVLKAFKSKKYYPDIKLANYENTKIIYPIIINEYEKRNDKQDLKGLLFGFGNIFDENIKSIKNITVVEDLYTFFSKQKNISRAFNFWNPDYCILELNIPNNIDLIPIDFYNFIKISSNLVDIYNYLKYLAECFMIFNNNIEYLVICIEMEYLIKAIKNLINFREIENLIKCIEESIKCIENIINYIKNNVVYLEKNLRESLKILIQNLKDTLTDLKYILTNLHNKKVNSQCRSFTQVHYSHLNIDDIVDLYPMMNYETGEIFKLDERLMLIKKSMGKI